MALSKDAFNEDLILHIRDYMLLKKQTIAVAESVTSGLLQTALALAPDASKFYEGGITAYNLGQKYKHLGVEPIHAEGCDCVSEKVAIEMAQNVCKLFCSDWGIGITGYAVPVPESGQKLFAFFAIVFQKKIVLKKRVTGKHYESLNVQLSYVKSVLTDLHAYLKKK